MRYHLGFQAVLFLFTAEKFAPDLLVLNTPDKPGIQIGVALILDLHELAVPPRACRLGEAGFLAMVGKSGY